MLFSYTVCSDHYCIIRRGTVSADDEFEASLLAAEVFNTEIGREDTNLHVTVMEVDI